VVYIPRKPHPNGLKAFLLASYVPHPARENAVLPYIIDIYPHLTVGDCPLQDVVRTFMQRWQIHVKSHFVGDSAFGSFGLMKEIQQWGGGATFSIPSNNNPWLWEVLSINVPSNHSRSVINGDSYIASSHILFDQKGKIIYQHIVTDAFSGTPCP
jgi:hypothetical protein